MDFGSEMLSVDHADIRKRDIGNNHCISWAKQKCFKKRKLLAQVAREYQLAQQANLCSV
jgi:hypothetical protein